MVKLMRFDLILSALTSRDIKINGYEQKFSNYCLVLQNFSLEKQRKSLVLQDHPLVILLIPLTHDLLCSTEENPQLVQSQFNQRSLLMIDNFMENQYQLDHSLDNYIQTLIDYGVIVNSKLTPAIFYLKNELKYPGLLTNKAVDGVEYLVKVPLDLILTSHKALKDPDVQQLFHDSFYKEGPLWQDRILVTYLLYLLSVDKNCIWTSMAKNFPKEIDIISFWNAEELDVFVDRSVAKAAGKERKHFQEEYQQFEEIQREYEQLQDVKWFNKENYKWIYIHTISRCFGSFLNSTYFVPYCELFNHHAVNVSYKCFDQSKAEKKDSIQIISDCDEVGSIQSGYSEDYLSDDDFDYMSINSYTIKWLSKISYDLKDKEVKIIDEQLTQIYDWMDRELQWKGFTLIYLGQIIEKIKILENQYKAGRKKFQHTLEKLQQTKLHVHAYRKYLVEHYRSMGRKYQKIKDERGVSFTHVKNTSWTSYEKGKDQHRESYTHFKMEAREGEHFDQHKQIYFCYGKLSNRTLLVRYGFCLEDNPYEHVWIKYSLKKEIQPYPDLFEKIQEKGLAVNYKMKLKCYTLALEPIIFMRMRKWKLTHHKLQHIFFITDMDQQLEHLQAIRQSYLQHLKRYDGIKDDLTDKEMSYHEYFARAYNVEKRNIINYQLDLIKKIEEIFERVRKHEVDVKEVMEKNGCKALKQYLKGLRGIITV